jgi:hypothetical protein
MSLIRVSQFNYQIHFTSVGEEFLKSILEMLNHNKLELGLGATVIKCETGWCIDFFANSVTKLMDVSFNYNNVVFLMRDLNNQNNILYKKFNHGFFYIDLKDIIVIDSSLFICINHRCLENINISGNFVFNYPFSRASDSAFFSPELLSLEKIPAEVNYKCFYYSLGALGIYLLFGKKLESRRDRDVENIVGSICNTKLYWALLRCVSVDCERRDLLFI